MTRWGTVFATIGILTYAGTAAADPAACMSAAERGQKERAGGKLLDAQKDFLVCAAPDCPSIVAKDCATWSTEVASALSSIVIDAKDASGQDVGEAMATIDGAIVAKQLDGKAILIDPGSHTLEISTNTGPARKASQTFIAKEGEKARPIHLVLGEPVSASSSNANADKGDGGHTILPWLTVGVGGALLVTGLVLFLTASTPEGCDDDTQTCAKRAGQTDADVQQNQEDAGSARGRRIIGVGSIVGGGVIAAAGLAWHFLEKPTTTASISPWLNGGSGGAVVRGEF